MDNTTIDTLNITWKRIFHYLKRASLPVLEELGLTKVDANIILVLKQEQPKTKAQLANYLSFKPNSLTRSLDRLIADQLVTRVVNADDRRFIQLSLTQLGESIANQYLTGLRQIWQQGLADIDDASLETLMRVLEKIQHNLYIPKR